MQLNFPALAEDKTFPYGVRQNTQAAVPLRQMDEERQKEFWAHLALRHCNGLGVRSRARLLNYFGSALNAIENKKFWRDASVKRECAKAFAKGNWQIAAKKEWDEAARTKAGILLWNSAFYPSRLRELIDAPSFLYYQGDLSLLKAPAIAIVGSRRPSLQGLRNSALIARELSAQGICVSSGMALGIDREAHLAALGKAGKSIGVLGTGIDVFYPFQNRDVYAAMLEKGLLISEFMPNQAPAGKNFPIRNRLISGLALGVLVIEAAEKSGSLITANYALEQNREVFAIDGKDSSEGCRRLIIQGAHAVFSTQDIIFELGNLLKDFAINSSALINKANTDLELQVPELLSSRDNGSDENVEFEGGDKEAEKELDFASQEQVEKHCQDALTERIMASLKKGSKNIEELGFELDDNINEINSKLIYLEILGQIRRLPGARFEVL